MSTVQDTSKAASPFGATNTAKAAKSDTEATQDRFLSLLMAQLKHQDPLNPLDNAQVTSQLAQLSTVQGIEDMNKSMQALAASLGTNQVTQAANLIGHGVLVPGDSISPAEFENVLGFELSRPADKVTARILDSSGRVVRNFDLGARKDGANMLVWDGLTDAGEPAAAGKYQFEIDAVQGGKPLSATTLSLGMVNSVSQNSQGVRLNLAGGDNVGYAEIRQIF
jgi:flagellar basal-body rod modification protein FlgD